MALYIYIYIYIKTKNKYNKRWLEIKITMLESPQVEQHKTKKVISYGNNNFN